MERDLTSLPKAHLHLHLTGSMRPATMRELAERYGTAIGEPRPGAPPEEAQRIAAAAGTPGAAWSGSASPTTSAARTLGGGATRQERPGTAS